MFRIFSFFLFLGLGFANCFVSALTVSGSSGTKVEQDIDMHKALKNPINNVNYVWCDASSHTAFGTVLNRDVRPGSIQSLCFVGKSSASKNLHIAYSFKQGLRDERSGVVSCQNVPLDWFPSSMDLWTGSSDLLTTGFVVNHVFTLQIPKTLSGKQDICLGYYVQEEQQTQGMFELQVHKNLILHLNVVGAPILFPMLSYWFSLLSLKFFLGLGFCLLVCFLLILEVRKSSAKKNK